MAVQGTAPSGSRPLGGHGRWRRMWTFAFPRHAPATRPAPAEEGGVRTLPARPDRAAYLFLLSGLFWLAVPGLFGLLMATLLFAPYLHDAMPAPLQPYLQFGRMRAMHVNVALFGWLSMTWVGIMLFVTPRLAGVPLYSQRLGIATWALWNAVVAGAFLSLLAGYNQGREYAEMAWPLDLVMLLAFALLAVNIWGTALRRREPRLYISIWTWMAATALIIPIYAVGNVVWDTQGALYGMNDAILNYFYVHNLFNAWFTTSFLGVTLWLLPRLSENPLFSYRLALWGFLTVWTGQHHLLYGPGPDWLELLAVAFSILAAIPNIAFTWNFVRTMEGAWSRAASSVPLRFLATGCAFYIFACVQGVSQSFRNFNALVHFTNWVVGHSHLAFVAAFTFVGFAALYHILPRIWGADPFPRRWQEWHYWLALGGISVFMVSLWAAGLIQGQNWMTGTVPFIETMRAMKPYMFLRLVGGLSMAAGTGLFAVAVLRGAWRSARPAPAAR